MFCTLFSCSSRVGFDTRRNSSGRGMFLCPTCSTSKQKIQSRSCFSVPTATEADACCSITERRDVALLKEVAIADIHQAVAWRAVTNDRLDAATNNYHQILVGK